MNESLPDAAPTPSRASARVLAAGADAPTRAAGRVVGGAPTVGGRACFFATTRKAYADGAEPTASYGAGYQRHYDAYAGPALRWAARILPDRVAPADAARLRWPERPGWWHPDAQPLGRPCFRRDAASGEVRLLRDRRTLVLAAASSPAASAAASATMASSRRAAAAQSGRGPRWSTSGE